jgi:hypothetical protein
MGMNQVISGPLVVLYKPWWAFIPNHTQVVVLPNGLLIMLFSGMKKGFGESLHL